MRRSLAVSCLVAAIATLASCAVAPKTPRAPEDYDRAIRLGAQWFLNNQSEEFLHYAYHLDEDRHSDERSALRELATLWVVALSANYLDDPRLHELALRGFAHFETFFVRDAEGDFLYVQPPSEPAGLGHSAFVVLTLLELEDHPRREEYLEQFTNGILSLQEITGKFRSYFLEDSDANQDYFPGEASMALMCLYERTGEARILDAVKLAFLHYSKYWDDHPRAAFAAWQIQANERLHEATNYERVRKFVFAMADFIIRHHRPEEGCKDFHLNGVFVGSRLEAINRAYKLARDVGDTLRADCYGNFVREASAYLLDLQITDAEAHAETALGGFPAKREPKLRVDRNQHAVAGLIEARRLGALDVEEDPGSPGDAPGK